MMRSRIVLCLLCLIVTLPSFARKKVVTDDGYVLKVRGVMESFPKIADGIGERLDFYKSKGLTHYFYCPSDDKYCNRWGWKFLYNDAERQTVRGLNELCRGKGLEFVWTLNPGERYGWRQDDYRFLFDKLVMMYYSGLRCFALDFTDNPGNHYAVRDSLLKDFVATRKEKVAIYIVDDIPEVEYPAVDHSAVESLMKGYYFDEAFVSKSKKADAIICNLSASDEFAKIAIVAAADFAKDPSGYSADHSMADAVDVLHGDVRDAFITFLQHTGKGGCTSPVELFSLEEWSEEKAGALYREFDRIEKVPELIGQNTGSEVLEALQPWLAEFGKLGTRGKKVLECMEYYLSGDLENFWKTYLVTRLSPEQQASYDSTPVGVGGLHPFCMDALSDMKDGFTSMLSGNTELHNLASTLYADPNAALDSDFRTGVDTGGYMEFAIPALAGTCHLLTGPLPKGEMVIFRQLRTDGTLVAEYVLKSAFTTFDLKDGAVKVDVSGNVTIYENIFVHL